MHCPDLIQIVELVKNYTEYKTNRKIARRLGITDRTLRRSLYDHAKAPYVPARQLQKYQTFFSEILPDNISLEFTKSLLQDGKETFHDLISPISGRAWSKLISARHSSLALKILKKPTPTLGFGIHQSIADQPAEHEISIGDYFNIEAKLGFNGEALIMAEHNNEWHLLKTGLGNTIARFSGPTVFLPGKVEENESFLKENGPPGFYRYFVLATKGAFPREFREITRSSNPLTQSQLDRMAEVFRKIEGKTIVLGTTLRVKEQTTL